MRLDVADMTCEHCVQTVTRAVRAVPGAGAVAVDLDAGTVEVGGSPDWAAVRAAIEAAGYDVRALAAD